MKHDVENDLEREEKHNLENLFVTLHDKRTRILWMSDDPTNERGMVGSSLINLWPTEEYDKLQWAINSCFMRSEPIGLTVRLSGGVRWRITMIPVDSTQMAGDARVDLNALAPGVSVIAIGSRLPENYEEIGADEKDLLRMLCDDCTLKQIASKMLLSESAIDAKIKKLKQKLDVHNIGGLVAAAINRSVI